MTIAERIAATKQRLKDERATLRDTANMRASWLGGPEKPCPRCGGKGFLNPDGSYSNAFVGNDSEPKIPCKDCNDPRVMQQMAHYDQAEAEASRCTCGSNGSVPGFFHGVQCDLHRTARLVFPCGAFFPISEWPNGHYAKDGAVRIGVFPSSQPHPTEETIEKVRRKYGIDWAGPQGGKRAPCQFFCPSPKRRKEEMGYSPDGKRGKYISCFARLIEDAVDGSNGNPAHDITPRRPEKCPHCEEQRTYVLACKRAAREKTEVPDREKWGLCPQCLRYQELTTDTDLCATCQLL